MLKLQFKDKRKAAIWLVDPRYAIGRDKSNDIVIDEDGVAGFHAELRIEDDDRIFLTDAGSATGTYVNGKQIKARTQLRAGDVIGVATAEMSLVDPKQELAGQPAPALADEATALTPALQGLSVGEGVGGVPTGWSLKAKTGSVAGRVFPLPASGRAIVGRSQNCDIVLAGTHVSRQHAELYFQSGKLHVKDLGSSNGTFLNRKRVEDAVVSPGDELRFDTLVFQVEAPAEKKPEEPAQQPGDSTMFRAQAVQVPDAGGKPAAKPAAKAEPRPVAASSAAEPDPVVPAAGGGSGAMVAIAVVVVLAGAAGAAYFLL